MGTRRIEAAMMAAAGCLTAPFAVLAVGGAVSAASGGPGFQLVGAGDLAFLAFWTAPLSHGLVRLNVGEPLRHEVDRLGLTGDMEVETTITAGRFGKSARAIVLLRHPIYRTVYLPQPDGTTMLYVQGTEGWGWYPQA